MKGDDIKSAMIEKSVNLLSTKMPRNTNWYSLTARQIAAQLIIEMVLKEFDVKKIRGKK